MGAQGRLGAWGAPAWKNMPLAIPKAGLEHQLEHPLGYQADDSPMGSDARTDRAREKQRGITGIETAIILIAFVIMGSVFAFTVLSSGVFASERAKETVFTGLEDTRNLLATRGAAAAFSEQIGGERTVYKVSFIVASAVSGAGIDLTPPATSDGTGTDPDMVTSPTNSLVLSYVDRNHFLPDIPWTVMFLGGNNGDNILEGNEKAQITAWLYTYDNAQAGGANAVAFMTTEGGVQSGALIGVNNRFSIEVKPARGAALTLERVTPAALTNVMDLK